MPSRKRMSKEDRRAVAKRRAESEDVGGGSNYLRMPEGFGFFSPKPGKFRLDFLPYEVKIGRGDSGGNPFFEKGEWAYERTFFVHRDVGPNKDWFLCPAKTLGEPCPVCEYRAKLARDPSADENVIKELAPKQRQLWIVIDLADPGKRLIWEVSYHLFGKMLKAKIAAGDEEDEYDFFADPEGGKMVRVNFEQSDRGKWTEATDIEFKPRREQYEADIVDEMPDLDAMLVSTPYEKLKKIFLQITEEEPDDDDRPTKRASGAEKSTKAAPKTAEKRQRPPDDTPTVDDLGLEEGDQVEYDGRLCEIVRISKDGTSLILEDEEGELVKAVGVDEVKKPKQKTKATPAAVEDDDEPAPKKKASKPKPADDEEDEPAPKKKAAPKKAAKDDDDWDDWD